MLSILRRTSVKLASHRYVLGSSASSIRMSSTASENTLKNEDTLPSLPVPPLQLTLKRYLDSVKPHVTPDEFKKTSQIVKAFEEGVGKELHQKLVERSKQERNWISEWWEKYAYHSLRYSTAVHTNLGGYLPMVEDVWPMQEGVQAERCSLALWHMLNFWDRLKKETIPVDIDRMGNKRLSMFQYSRLFNTCRIPGVPFDWLEQHFKTESEGKCPSHLVILRNGRFFTFNAVDENGQLLTAPEIQSQIEYIKTKCDREPSLPSVAALTALERTTWTEMRDHLIKIDPKNADRLKIIESCVLLTSIQNSAPETLLELSHQAIATDPYNQWFDQPFQLMSHRNGAIAFNGDHSAADGIAIMVMVYNAYTGILQNQGKWKGPKEIRQLPPPEEIMFTIDEKVAEYIDEGAKIYKKGTDNIDLVRGETSLDRNLLKAKKLHPDAIVQLALQLTYMKIHKKPGPCYETATTRQFYRGRTETVRSCSVEMVDWCRAMLDPQSSTKDRLELLHRAVAKQNTLMEEGKENAGCDRHLFGLQILAMENGLPTPELFEDEAYTKSGGGGNYILSTSLAGYTSLLGCVVPMVPNGYGLFYSMPKQRLRLMVLTWKDNEETNSQLFYQIFEKTVQETMALTSEAKL